MLALGPLGLGPTELVLVLAIILIVFGAGRLAEAGGAIGRSIREFRKASRDEDEVGPEGDDQREFERKAASHERDSRL